MYNKVADIYCKDPNLLLSVFNEMVESGMNEEEALSRLYAFCPTKRAALYLHCVLPISWNNIFICPETRNSKDPSDSKEIEKYIKWIKTFDMKFDYVIQNPPYNGSLHLDFLEKGLDLLTEKGRMVIIEPATWLINVKTTGNAKKYNAIKERLSGHVESVIIENRNNDFNTNLRVPFATVTIDFSKTYESIEFVCCGEKKIVKSLYDCNLIGDYSVIWSILNKVKAHGDVMDNHTTKEKMEDGMYYTKYADIIGGAGGALCSATTDRVGVNYDGESFWKNTAFGDFCTFYTSPAYHFYKNSISSEPLCSYDKGKHLTTKIADNLYGTKSELENWKHFVFKNKLPLFINIVINVNERNCSKDFLPWLVDRTYTDDEINEMFGFTEEEIALIDRTIKKYERNSPWFRRYICGPDSVSDEEVNNFINSL